MVALDGLQVAATARPSTHAGRSHPTKALCQTSVKLQISEAVADCSVLGLATVQCSHSVDLHRSQSHVLLAVCTSTSLVNCIGPRIICIRCAWPIRSVGLIRMLWSPPSVRISRTQIVPRANLMSCTSGTQERRSHQSQPATFLPADVGPQQARSLLRPA